MLARRIRAVGEGQTDGWGGIAVKQIFLGTLLLLPSCDRVVPSDNGLADSSINEPAAQNVVSASKIDEHYRYAHVRISSAPTL